MLRTLAAVLAVTAFASPAVMAEPSVMTDAQLDLIVAGGHCGCEEYERGDNGWGNGIDGTNNGSFVGMTAESKTTTLKVIGVGPPNNIFDKFDGR
jgi:hypothetical protein